MKRIAVMIVDDHARVRAGLRTFLSTCPDLQLVAEAKSGQEVLERCAEAKPDVVVLDVMMPATDGPTLTGRIREVSPGSEVVALSSFEDRELINRAMKAGAAGWALKDSSPERLVTAIRDADRGRAETILEGEKTNEHQCSTTSGE